MSATEQQLTRWVQLLFDMVVSSMDWGSGFLDTAEVVEVLAIAEFLGVTQQAPGFRNYSTPADAAIAEKFPELHAAYHHLRKTDFGHRTLYQSEEHRAYNEKFQIEVKRLEAEHQRRLHEQAHQLLLRKLPADG